MPMRCRSPARELHRTAAQLVGLQTDQVEQFDDSVAALSLGLVGPVDDHALSDDVLDPHTRVERGVGVLEDHLHLRTKFLHRMATIHEHIGAGEADLTAGRFDEPQETSRCRRLAGAGLPHQTQHLTLGHVERDVVDRAVDLFVTSAADRVVLD